MTDPNRRNVMGKIALVSGVAGMAGAAATSLAAQSGDITLSAAIKQSLANLMAAVEELGAGSISSDLRRLFAAGATIASPVDEDGFLIAHDPLRALVIVSVNHGGMTFDIPIIATFAGIKAAALKIVALRSGPANPFAAVPAGTVPSDARTGGNEEDLQARYDRMVAAGGGVLAIPAGQFLTNLVLHSRTVHITGAGRRATRLLPRNSAQPVLRAEYREGSWDYVTIANLDIAGNGGRGIGFAAGAETYVAGDEFAGRTRFINVGFADLNIAIRRSAGQIGLSLDQCGFGRADFHLYSFANRPGRGELMHSGVLTARDCHFTGARQAVAYMNSAVAGTGAVLFDNCIMERNPGFVFYIEAFANVDATTDFVVRDCWNEANATAAGTVINGSTAPARYASLNNVGMARFEGTPLGALTLRNAVVETYSCALDNLSTVDKDASSSLCHHNARGFGSYVPLGLVASVAAAAQSEPPGRALTFKLPHRTTIGPVPGGAVLMATRADKLLFLTGTISIATRAVPNAVLPGVETSQHIVLRRGMQVFPSSVAIAPAAWIVWIFVYRRISGSGAFLQVSGDRGISARRPLDSTDWETLGGMAAVSTGARAISLWLIQEGDAAELLLGGQALVSFPTRQGALDFLNAGIFPEANSFSTKLHEQ